MANPAPTINQINAFNATQGTTIDFNIIGGTELVRSNRIYIYDLSDNSLICTHLYVSTESIHELPSNTDASMVYESGKSSADFVNGKQYYAQIQTFTDIGGTEGGSGLSVAKMFWCLDDPTLTIDTIPSTISTTSYNVSATYNANTSVVSNIIQQYQFSLYSATGSLLQSSGVVVGNGEQQGTSTAYDISYNFTGLSVGSSYYVVVDVTTTQGMSVSAQSSTFTVSIDTPTLGEATVVNNACDGYISVTSNLSSEYGGSGSGDIVSFETDSENVFSKLQVTLSPIQSGSGTPSPSNVRPIYGVGGVTVHNTGTNIWDEEWELGYFNTNTGQPVASTSISRSKNFIPCLPSTSYYYKSNGANHTIVYYDEAQEFISLTTAGGGDSLITTPSNCHYMKIAFVGTTYNNDISINYQSTDHDYHAYDGQTVSEQFNVSLTPTSKDTDPYLFKAVGDVYGDRLEEELVGGTVCWNQLAKYNARTGTVSGISYTVASDGTVTLSAGTTTGVIGFNADVSFTGKNGHVIYIGGCPSGGEDGYYYFRDGYEAGSRNLDIGNGVIVKKTNDNLIAQIYVGSGKTIPTLEFKPQITDLTQHFGSAAVADAIYAMEQATAGSGIALLKASGFFNGYTPYDAGTLKSVSPTAHITRGVNQWDEEWELGSIGSNGQNILSTTTIRSKNYIRVIPNTRYYFHCGSFPSVDGQGFADVIGYNQSKGFYNYIPAGGYVGKYTLYLDIPDNVYYIRFTMYRRYGTTYKNDICINISDPTINGKYFPYEEHTYPLGDVTLRGKFELINGELKAVGDIYKHDGSVTRKIVHLPQGATYTLVNTSSTGYKTYSYNTSNARVAGNTCPITNFGLKGVSSFSSATVNEECIQLTAPSTSSNAGIYFAIASTRDIADFVMEYELATPTTETTDPFEQIQEVSEYGTLEYITTNDIPVGHNTTYLTRDIFGGTLDLVSGVLTVTYGLIDLGTRTYSKESESVFYADLTSLSIKSQPNTAIASDVISSSYATKSVNSIQTSKSGVGYYTYSGNGHTYLYIGDSRYSTGADLKQALNGVQLVYPLATPQTYQLTPQQIQTLVGVNNVWSEQGDIELSYHIPITNLLVKRQDVGDVSGSWLTLYSQPITQASDMDFTFIDFTNQYGKTYKYALVPLLTQTQSGVEVEVEGGYTVSDEVQSIFDGVFIADSTGSQKCKANVGYGNVNMNQSVGSITPIGSQYPIIVTNSNNRYHNGSISGMIVPDDYYYNGNLSRIDMVNKRNELEQFLTNKRAKIIKDWNSNIWLVMIMDNIDCSFDNNYGMGIVTFNANWLEVGDPTNQEDLQATGLVDVGGV